MSRRSLAALLIALAAATTPLLAACGDDDSDTSSGTETVVTAVSDAAPEDLERWQTDLNAVGCYAGAVDGSLGPETEAAIREFQAAAGLQVDGQLGPETEGALQQAVSAGETVCADSGGGTTTAGTTTAGTTTSGGATTTGVSLVSDDYDKTFAIDSCSFDAVNEGLTLEGSADGVDITIDVTDGAGSLAVGGGTEQDGVTLNGNITSTGIGEDGAFDLAGTYAPPTDEGEGFSISGTCPS